MGDPQTPRIEPLPPGEWDELLRELLARSPGGTDRPLNVFTTIARNPDLFRRWLGFGGALLSGRLGVRARELAILRTAHNCASEYEWAQHVPMAAAAGVSEEEIADLQRPLSARPWQAPDLLLLRAVDELHETSTLSDPTWEALAVELDDATLIELVMLVGHYHLLAMTLSALRVQIEES